MVRVVVDLKSLRVGGGGSRSSSTARSTSLGVLPMMVHVVVYLWIRGCTVGVELQRGAGFGAHGVQQSVMLDRNAPCVWLGVNRPSTQRCGTSLLFPGFVVVCPKFV